MAQPAARARADDDPCPSRVQAARDRRQSGPIGGRRLRRWSIWLFNLRVPSGLGVAASTVFLLATLAYGVVVGDHIPDIVASLKDARDAAANAAGFRIARHRDDRRAACQPGGNSQRRRA